MVFLVEVSVRGFFEVGRKREELKLPRRRVVGAAVVVLAASLVVSFWVVLLPMRVRRLVPLLLPLMPLNRVPPRERFNKDNVVGAGVVVVVVVVVGSVGVVGLSVVVVVISSVLISSVVALSVIVSSVLISSASITKSLLRLGMTVTSSTLTGTSVVDVSSSSLLGRPSPSGALTLSNSFSMSKE